MNSTIPILEEAQQHSFLDVFGVLTLTDPALATGAWWRQPITTLGLLLVQGSFCAVLTTPQITLRLNFVERHLNTTTIRS
jgi:hypothetical protein